MKVEDRMERDSPDIHTFHFEFMRPVIAFCKAGMQVDDSCFQALRRSVAEVNIDW